MASVRNGNSIPVNQIGYRRMRCMDEVRTFHRMFGWLRRIQSTDISIRIFLIKEFASIAIVYDLSCRKFNKCSMKYLKLNAANRSHDIGRMAVISFPNRCSRRNADKGGGGDDIGFKTNVTCTECQTCWCLVCRLLDGVTLNGERISWAVIAVAVAAALALICAHCTESTIITVSVDMHLICSFKWLNATTDRHSSRCDWLFCGDKQTQ